MSFIPTDHSKYRDGYCDKYQLDCISMRIAIVTGTPDDLDDISDSSSVYSHEQAVRSRMEKGKPKNDWGDQSQWFENSKVELDRVGNIPRLSPNPKLFLSHSSTFMPEFQEATKVSVESAQVSTGSAQALNSEDVEQGHGSNVSIRTWIPCVHVNRCHSSSL